MSIFGSIKDAAESAAGMVGETAKSVGKAVSAPVLVPAGVVWDIAASPKDWKADLVQGGTTGISRMLDPLTNTSSLTGTVAAPVMGALETIYREGVSEPLATSMTMASHIDGGDGTHYGDLFSGEAWSHAYKIAQTQSFGQSVVLALGTGEDPFHYKKPYEETIHKDHPLLASLTSGTVDAAVRWELDPGLLAGKGIKATKTARAFRPITEAEQSRVGELSETETLKRYGVGPFKFIPSKGLKTRYDALTGTIDSASVHEAGWLDGKGATQIYRGYKPLQEIDGGVQIADLFAQTNKIENVADKINTRRTILRVLNGDHQTIADLETSQKFIADQLANIANGSVTGNKASVVVDDVFKNLAGKGITPPSLPFGSDPVNLAEAERQVHNLPDVTKWLQGEEERLNTLLGTFGEGGRPGFAGTLKGVSIPGAKADRAILREEGQGLLRNGVANTGHERLNGVLDGTLAHVVRPIDSLYQASPSSMPVRIIHGIVAKPLISATVKAPPRLFDSFRNARPEGFVNVNDADDSFRQLDAFLRKAGAASDQRLSLGNKMAAATSASERANVLAQAEAHAQEMVFAKYGIDSPTEFARELTRRGQAMRNAMLTSTQGRAYSATQRAEGDVRALKAMYASKRNGVEPVWKELRVDQIDEHGTPVSLPFLETQDASLLPMIDVNMLDRMAARHQNVFRAAARTWRDENLLYDPSVGAHVKRRAGQIFDLGGQASANLSDHMFTILDELNRAWKFSVLFRLGYPARVLMDDHMRIAAAFGASTLINGIKDGTFNSLHNLAAKAPYVGLDRTELHALQGEHALLEMKIGSPEMLERNQFAYKRLAQIDKKLRKVKSTTVRRELEQERQLIMDHHPEDLSEAVARKAEIEQSVKSGTYKRAKKQIGDKGRVDENGTYIPGAFEGTYGELFREINSASTTWNNLGETLESEIHASLSRGASHRVVLPSEEGHLASWEYAINNHLRNSELAGMIIKGKTADDVVKFLTSTARGRELSRRFAFHAGNPEQWAANIEKMVDEYLPTARLREIAAERNVTAKELDKMFQDVNQRPSVHGGMLDSTLESGNMSTRLNHMYSKFYSWVGRRNDAMSRHPLFVSLYNDEVSRLVPMRREIAARQGRELTNADIEHVAHRARLYAKKHVTRTLFEMGSTSEMAHFLRLVSPFFGAWQEGMNRWWRIVSKDPSVLRKFQLGFDAPRRLGLVVDEDGNPVKPGEFIADNHYILMQMPQAWGGKDPSKYQTQFKVSESSFNLIFQGGGLFNPGFGPVVQFPANELAKRNADNKELQAAIEKILPMGTRADSMDMFTSGTLKYGLSYASAKWFGHHSATYEQYQKQVLRDMVVEWEQQHPNGKMDTATTNRLIAESEQKTIHLMGIKAASAMFSPAAIQVQSKFTPQLLAYRRLQEQAANDPSGKKDSRWVDDQFVKEWGEAYFPLMQSSSANPAGLNQSAETVAAIKANRGLLNMVDPSLYRMVIGHKGEGAYSQTAYNYLSSTAMRPGSSETFIQPANPRDAMEKQQVSQGWFDYNKLTTKLMVAAHAQGLASYVESDDLMARKKKAIMSLGEHNSAWWQDYNSFNSAEYDAKVEGMRTIASDPSLKKDSQRTDIFALQQYLTLRDAMTAELQRRALAGGSATMSAQSNVDLATGYRKAISSLVESNTWFEQYMFNGTIEHDPYLTAAATTAGSSTSPWASAGKPWEQSAPKPWEVA